MGDRLVLLLSLLLTQEILGSFTALDSGNIGSLIKAFQLSDMDKQKFHPSVQNP